MAPWQVAAACHSWLSQMMGEDNDHRPLEFADETCSITSFRPPLRWR